MTTGVEDETDDEAEEAYGQQAYKDQEKFSDEELAPGSTRKTNGNLYALLLSCPCLIRLQALDFKPCKGPE
ncbi:hypothetical protein N7490_003717 [Penicillium lividum]|nr:hypothetical protein N7490_003717 [Penicillium lividum]